MGDARAVKLRHEGDVTVVATETVVNEDDCTPIILVADASAQNVTGILKEK